MRDYEALQMGLIEANSVVIKINEKPLWQARGFVEARNHGVFLYELAEDETIMLGVPQTLLAFGCDRLIGGVISDISGYLGTYGMGGAGFVGLKIENIAEEPLWLTAALWGAAEYIFFDGRLLEVPARYEQEYPFWCTEFADWKVLAKRLKNAVIKNAMLNDEEFVLELSLAEQTTKQLVVVKNSPQLPPMGSGIARKDAFAAGVMGEAIVLIYDGTILEV